MFELKTTTHAEINSRCIANLRGCRSLYLKAGTAQQTHARKPNGKESEDVTYTQNDEGETDAPNGAVPPKSWLEH